MHSHGAFGDREAQSGSTTTLPITRIFGAVKWSKDLIERFFGNTIPTIANADDRVAILPV